MSSSLPFLDKPPERILLCRTDRLGDVILSLPCVLLLKRLFPDRRVSLLVQPYTAPVARLMIGLDEVIEADNEEDAASIAQVLHERGFDAAVALFHQFRIARALKKAGIPLRSGIAYRWYSFLFNYRHREHRKLNLKHEVEYNLSLTYATFRREGRWEDLLGPNDIFPLDLNLPRQSVEKVDVLLEDVSEAKKVVIHPGGGGSAYRWPTKYYCTLGSSLKKEKKVRIIITGGAEESDLCAEVAEASGQEALNLCGKLSLPDLVALFQKCSLLITNSTGPLHLGRMVGAQVLGLFPSDHAMSPMRWGPYRLPANALTPPPGESMEHLNVESVLNRALELLG